MNELAITEEMAYDLVVKLFALLAKGALVSVVCLGVLVVVLIVGGCWQTICEARKQELAKRHLRLNAASPIRFEARHEDRPTSNPELLHPAGPHGRCWGFKMRRWECVVSINRIEKSV